jgi:sulfide dehydrogenase cytochrome subunit
MRKAIALAATVAAFAASIAIAQTPPAATPATPAAAPAAVPGGVLAATCTGCHGKNGVSAGEIPGINGRTETQLLTAMLDFKNDRRPATVMNRHAKGFSDAEIAELSRYIAANWR